MATDTTGSPLAPTPTLGSPSAAPSSTAAALRVSELANELTESIDTAELEAAVRMLQASDAQLFTGYRALPSMFDERPLGAASRLAAAMAAAVADDGLVVFTGSGTSGRLAFLLAAELNSRVARRCPARVEPSASEHVEGGAFLLNGPFQFLIAGGLPALVAAQESAEDSAFGGVEDLARLLLQCPRPATERGSVVHRRRLCVVVGITCGMSATYSGAQLHWLLHASGDSRAHLPDEPFFPTSEGNTRFSVEEQERLRSEFAFVPVLFGFNPREAVLARRIEIPGWAATMADVVDVLHTLEAANHRDDELGPEPARDGASSASSSAPRVRPIILDPVVGPESIAGSTRMKGGSATKILIETIGLHAIEAARRLRDPTATAEGASDRIEDRDPTSPAALRHTLERFQRAVDEVYTGHAAVLARAADAGSATLRDGGRIVYVGEGSEGWIGVIDASECPPTYGASFEDVQGAWIPTAQPEEAWDAVLGRHPGFQSIRREFDESRFETEVLPTLTARDLVVSLAIERAPAEASEDRERGTHGVASTARKRLVRLARVRGARVLSIVVRGCGGDDRGHGDRGGGGDDGDGDLATGSRVSGTSAERGADEEAGTAAATAVEMVPIVLSAVVGRPDDTDLARAIGGCLADLAMKLTVNCLSTLAHVQKGCVFRNRMINLQVTNFKLFFRAVHLIASLAGVADDDGVSVRSDQRPLVSSPSALVLYDPRHCLLCAIYRTDAPSDAVRDAPVPAHVAAVVRSERTVPLAILLALARRQGHALTVEEGRTRLVEDPVVRRCLLRFM